MGTVSKALSLLDHFNRQQALIGLSEFSRLSGLNKATCFRMLSELAELGFVEQVGRAREYRLGPQVLRLAALREAAVPMRDAAMPVLRGLAQSLGETVHLSVLIGEKLRMLGFAYSPAHAMAVMMEDTDTLPFHATSSGLAVLGFSPLLFQDQVLARPLVRLTAQTLTDPVAVRARVVAVGGQGYATSAGGFEAEVDSIAFPLFDGQSRCCGALAVAAPAARLTAANRLLIRAEVAKAARQIIALWGGQVPPGVNTLWQGLLNGTLHRQIIGVER